MSYSNRPEGIKQSSRRLDDSRNLRNSKNAQSKVTASKIGHLNYDNFGKISVNSPCAFHPSQKITNFCTNKECLLPLCPKCVKIHTDEHIKMGIFGEFDTIEESLRLAEDGLRYTFDKLGELETLLVDIKQGYQSKIGEQRRKLRQAKNYFVEQIQNIFDCYEKALINIQNQQNQEFLEEMYSSDAMLNHLTEHFQKCHRKLGNGQTLMEGIINYFSQAEEIERVEISQEKLQKLFPETINIVYHTSELERLEATVKRYLDLNKRNDPVWSQFKRLSSKDDPTAEKPKEVKKESRLSPIRTVEEKPTPKKGRQQVFKQNSSTNAKISELGHLESNLNLGKFRSPLDNFSLSNNRKNKYDLK